MDWIASQYRMRFTGWKPKECFDSFYPSYTRQNKARTWFSLKEKVVPGTGDVDDIQKEDCKGSFNYDHIVRSTEEFRSCSEFEKLVPDQLSCTDDCRPNCTEVENFAESCKQGTIEGCKYTTTIWASQKIDRCAFDEISTNGTRTWSQCRLQGAEGFSYNIYQCQNKEGEFGVCANNCKGVNPNSIIIGGFATVAVAAVAAQSTLQAAVLGVGGLGAVAGIGAMGLVQQCPNSRPCRVSRQKQRTILLRPLSFPSEAKSSRKVEMLPEDRDKLRTEMPRSVWMRKCYYILYSRTNLMHDGNPLLNAGAKCQKHLNT